MLTIDFIREHQEMVAKFAKLKNRVVDLAKILDLDDQQKLLIVKIQTLRAERNKLAKENGKNPESINRGKELKKELKDLEEQEEKIKTDLEKELLRVPNVAYSEVPLGKDENDNQEVKRVGKPKKMDFVLKSHLELIKDLDLADLERGAKVAGYRGYFLKGKLAILHLAVLFYTFQKLAKKGYTPLIAPSLVKEFTLFGSAQFPWGRDEAYHLEKDDLYLSGTAEIPVTSYYANEILNEKDLPKKFVAFSPCFRREIGNYGKDTKGLYRVHEFWKVEQVIIGKADDKEARALHEELLKNTEEILTDLELPYRVLLMCTGDMGEPQVKKYDLEIWMPYKNNYGEIASNSIMSDFQARRLKIRYRNLHNEIKTCYTLNDTAIPSPRVLIGLLENHQEKDGSISIPKVLQPFCGFDKISK